MMSCGLTGHFEEHNAFVRLIRNEGVKVWYLHELLTETLSAGDEIRQEMIDGVSAEMTVGISALDAVRICLMDMEPARSCPASHRGAYGQRT